MFRPVYLRAVIAVSKMFWPSLWKQLNGMTQHLKSAQTWLRSAKTGFKSAPQGLKSAQTSLQVGTNSQVGTDILNVFNTCTKNVGLETVFASKNESLEQNRKEPCKKMTL
jgi:hypothetical protein